MGRGTQPTHSGPAKGRQRDKHPSTLLLQPSSLQPGSTLFEPNQEPEGKGAPLIQSTEIRLPRAQSRVEEGGRTAEAKGRFLEH